MMGQAAEQIGLTEELRSQAGLKPRVAIFIDTARIGGPGKGLLQLIGQLQDLKSQQGLSFDYTLVTFDYGPGSCRDFINYAVSRGLTVRTLKERFRFDPSTFAQAARIIDEGEYNIVQTHGYKTHVLGVVLSYWKRLAWIAVSHGWTKDDLKVKFYQSLDRLLLRFPDVAVAVTPVMAERIAAFRGAGELRTILNAVDQPAEVNFGEAAVIRATCNVKGEGTLLGSFGRLSKEKGHAHLVRAFARVLKYYPETRLLILGEGPEEQNLRELIGELGLTDRIKLRPYQQELVNYFEALDLFVLPSLDEGLPNVVLEAMSQEVPVLATRVGGLEEIIKSGENGWLVEPQSEQGLTDMICRVLDDKNKLRAMGKVGQASLYPKFSPTVRAAKFYDLYVEMLERKGGA